MLRRATDIVARYFRLGYTPLALLLPGALVTLLAVDATRFVHFGLSPLTAFQVGVLAPAEEFRSVVILVVSLLFVLPMVVALLRIVTPTRPTYLTSGSSPRTILCWHLCATAILAWGVVFAHNLEIVSGNSQLADQPATFAFTSWFYTIADSHALSGAGGWMVTAFSGLFMAAITYVMTGMDELAKPIRQFLIRSELKDLAPQFQPVNRWPRERTFAAPSIGAISRMSDGYWRGFRRTPASSDTAVKVLDDLARQCATVVDREVAGNQQRTLGNGVRLFSGTAAAFQAALTQNVRYDALVLSPFGSPSLKRFGRWYSALSGTPSDAIEFSPVDLLSPWHEQQERLLQHLAKTAAQYRRVAVCISEVSYATGLRLPLPDLLGKIRALPWQEEVCIVIDGTNAVGNRGLVTIDGRWDHYVFSVHRWLMAPSPCAVLLSRSGSARECTDPGEWQVGARKTDLDARMITGLRSALALLEQPKYEFFRNRCEKLTKEFKLELPHAVRTAYVPEMEETFVLCCYPKDGQTGWKFSPGDAQTELNALRARASIVQPSPDTWWLRVAVPYYTDVRDLILLTQVLNKVTR